MNKFTINDGFCDLISTLKFKLADPFLLLATFLPI